MNFFLVLILSVISFWAEIDLHISKPYKIESTNITIGPGIYYSEKNFKELAREILNYKEEISSSKLKIQMLEQKIEIYEWRELKIKSIKEEMDKIVLQRVFIQKQRESLNKEREKLWGRRSQLYKRENRNLRWKNRLLKISVPATIIGALLLK